MGAQNQRTKPWWGQILIWATLSFSFSLHGFLVIYIIHAGFLGYSSKVSCTRLWHLVHQVFLWFSLYFNSYRYISHYFVTLFFFYLYRLWSKFSLLLFIGNDYDQHYLLFVFKIFIQSHILLILCCRTVEQNIRFRLVLLPGKFIVLLRLYPDENRSFCQFYLQIEKKSVYWK